MKLLASQSYSDTPFLIYPSRIFEVGWTMPNLDLWSFIKKYCDLKTLDDLENRDVHKKEEVVKNINNLKYEDDIKNKTTSKIKTTEKGRGPQNEESLKNKDSLHIAWMSNYFCCKFVIFHYWGCCQKLSS